MAKHFTIQDLQQLQAAGKIRGYQIKKKTDKQLPTIPASTGKKSKYGNNKVYVDGIEFDSQREADRYCDLKLMLKVGEIGQLQLQVEFELNAGGTHSLKYIADFVYIDAKTGETIVEDAKGCLTREYKKKRRLMKKVHNIKIKEV